MRLKFFCLIIITVLVSQGSILNGGDGTASRTSVRSEMQTRNFAGGDGSVENPYQISNVSQLQKMSTSLSSNFILNNSIDATETKDWNGGDGFVPVGKNPDFFKGSLNGNNFTIYNLTIDRGSEDEIGLFGRVEGGWIHHVEVRNAQINGKDAVGILSGYCRGSRIENCMVDGSIMGISSVGGVIGNCQGDTTFFSNTSSTASLSNGDPSSTILYFGGMVGFSGKVILYNCSVNGPISMTQNYGYCSDVGGLAGLLFEGYIDQCRVDGKISYSGYEEVYNIGGLVGYINKGSLSNCRTGCSIEISTDKEVEKIGGVIGWFDAGGTIQNTGSYTSIKIEGDTGPKDVGGLIGDVSNSKVTNCLWRKWILVKGVSDSEISYLGGFIGNNLHGEVSRCYAIGEITLTASSSSILNVGGLVGFSENQQSLISSCQSYVYLNISSSVFSVREIGGLVGYSLDGSVSDSNCYGEMNIESNGGPIIGIGAVVGSNKGELSQCFSFNTLVFSGEAELDSIGGIAGYNDDDLMRCRSTGSIFYHLVGSVVTVKNIGGLVGQNDGGDIYICHSNCTISPMEENGENLNYNIQRAGVLIGLNDNEGWVSNCFSTGSISINESSVSYSIGGLIGQNQGDVEFCYSTVSMFFNMAQSSQYLGGLIGYNSGKVHQAYTSLNSLSAYVPSGMGGLVGKNTASGRITSCFFENVSSDINMGVNSDESGTAEINLTLKMKERETFAEKGWRFESDWGIIEGVTYPWLFNIYHDPIIVLDHWDNALEDEDFIIDFKVTHSEYPSINDVKDSDIHLSTSADWLRIDKATRKISGIPDNDDVGTYWMNLTVEDLVGSISFRNVSFEVVNVNDPPEIVTENKLSAVEDEPYSNNYYANDKDPIRTEYSWEMSTNAKWLFFNVTQPILYGTPKYLDIGTFWVNVSVHDQEGGCGFTNFTLTVISSNHPPEITSSPVLIAYEDELYVMDLKVVDVDRNDRLTWSLISGPHWILFTRTQIKGTPTNDDVGRFWVELRVTDIEGAYDDLGFILEVRNTNDVPLWNEFPEDQNLTEGDPILLFASAIDVDIEDALNYSLTSDPPSNISISASTGAISWLSTEPGNYSINATASDGVASIWKVFNITVNEIQQERDPNHSPYLEHISDQVVEVGKTFSMEIPITDEDNDTLMFSLVKGSEGMAISANGELIWTPFLKDLGSHSVNISVSDGKVTLYSMFIITVIPSSTDDDDLDDDDTRPDDDQEQEAGSESTNESLYLLVIAILTIFVIAVLVLFYWAMKSKDNDLEDDGSEEE